MMSERPNNFASSYARKSYEEIVQAILDQITKGSAKEKIVFRGSQMEYQLKSHPLALVAVEGIAGGKKYTFEKGSDYVFVEERGVLAWRGKTKPDEGTEFTVAHIFKEPSGLTDTNPGSVLRTIVESIGKELDHVFDQMDGVYKSGFIDTAMGDALDHVVALIGMERKPPTRSMGHVTFWRNSDPPDIAISNETILFDGREEYPLNQDPLKNITAVNGILKGIQYSFSRGKDFEMDKQKNSLVWLMGGARPDTNTPFSVDYVVHEKIIVPQGLLVATAATQQSSSQLFETMNKATLQKAETGKWEADVQVRALKQGQQGNVIPGAITLMPKPAIGVEHIINRSKLAGGTDRETDEALRNRAKQALELAGKATLGSLRAALESIEGIQSAPRIKENPDGIPGLVKVVIDGGADEEIRRVIESTRAAGVRIEFYRPKIVSLDFDLVIIPKTIGMSESQMESLKSLITAKIRDFVSSLKIDEDMVYYQLLSAILGIDGVRDIRQMAIEIYKDGAKVGTSSKDNIIASEDENLTARIVKISFQNDNSR